MPAFRIHAARTRSWKIQVESALKFPFRKTLTGKQMVRLSSFNQSAGKPLNHSAPPPRGNHAGEEKLFSSLATSKKLFPPRRKNERSQLLHQFRELLQRHLLRAVAPRFSRIRK